MKKGSKRPAAPTDENLIDESGHGLSESIACSRAMLATIREELDTGERTPSLIRDAAGLMRGIAAMSAELRQREKHVREVVANMSDEDEQEFLLAMIRRTNQDTLQAVRLLVDELSTQSIL